MVNKSGLLEYPNESYLSPSLTGRDLPEFPNSSYYENNQNERADQLRQAKQAERIEKMRGENLAFGLPYQKPPKTTTTTDNQELAKTGNQVANVSLGALGESTNDKTNERDENDYADDLRASKQKDGLLNKAKGAAKQATMLSEKATFNKLLQQAWLNLIDSFGLTLIWINIHAFLSLITSNNLFCKLGEEWTSMPIGMGEDAKTGLSINGLKGNITMSEWMLLILCDLLVLLILLAAFVLLVVAIRVITDPAGTVVNMVT